MMIKLREEKAINWRRLSEISTGDCFKRSPRDDAPIYQRIVVDTSCTNRAQADVDGVWVIELSIGTMVSFDRADRVIPIDGYFQIV